MQTAKAALLLAGFILGWAGMAITAGFVATEIATYGWRRGLHSPSVTGWILVGVLISALDGFRPKASTRESMAPLLGMLLVGVQMVAFLLDTVLRVYVSGYPEGLLSGLAFQALFALTPLYTVYLTFLAARCIRSHDRPTVR